MRYIVAGELAGACSGFRGIGAQWANPANIADVAPACYQETASRLHDAQNNEWRQPARGRRDLSRAARQLAEPFQLGLLRITAGQKKDFELRLRDQWEGEVEVRRLPKVQRERSLEVAKQQGLFTSKGRT